jgi:hypothetical protein
MDKSYKIEKVVPRDPWTGKFGTFNSFAMELSGVDGWVELSQKPETPAPEVGKDIFGHIDSTTNNGKTYMKFKKQKPQEFGGGSSMNQKDIDYIIMMLEELTLRRDSPDSPTPRDVVKPKVEDILPTESDMAQPIDLSTIPF